MLGKSLRKNDAYVTLRDLANRAYFLIQIEARTKTDLMELLEVNKNKMYEVIGFMKDKGFPVEKRKLSKGVWHYCYAVEKPKLETFLQNME